MPGDTVVNELKLAIRKTETESYKLDNPDLNSRFCQTLAIMESGLKLYENKENLRNPDILAALIDIFSDAVKELNNLKSSVSQNSSIQKRLENLITFAASVNSSIEK